MVISRDFFYLDLHIGQLDNLAVGENLDQHIKRYSKEFLNLLLGKALAARYLAGFDSDPEMEELDAILVDREEDISPIANYVFCKYLENTHALHQGIGVVVPKAENALVVNPIVKIVRAWNLMVDEICKIHREISALNLKDYRYEGFGRVCGGPCGSHAVFQKRNRLGL